MEGYQGSVRSVMKESKRGALNGIHGPLSQLINVKDKYSVAVETALGVAIQNIVVDYSERRSEVLEQSCSFPCRSI